MTGTPCAAAVLGDVEHRRELRHADARDHAGRADRAGADADLDRVGAGLDQRLGAAGGGDIAGDHLHARCSRRRIASTASSTPRRMAVRGIDHQHVDAGLDQRLGPLQPGRAGADRGADPQPAVRVLAGVREESAPSRCP